MTNVSPNTAETALHVHFNLSSGTVCRVTPTCDIDAIGFTLTDEEIIGLSGAPTGSVVTAYFEPEPAIDASKINDGNKVEEVPPGLYLKVLNPDYIGTYNQVILYPIEADNDRIAVGIYIKLVDFLPKAADKKSFTGIGGYMVAAIARAARPNPDILEIRLQAAGGRSWNDRTEGGRWYGYAAWPKYGFDMPVHQLTTSMYPFFKYEPPKLAACVYVSEVLALGKSGAEFWKTVGDGWDMTFNLDPGGKSLPALSSYLKFEV